MEKKSLFLLRFTLGFMFFYSGLIKLTDPSWTSEAYLHGAQNFSVFFEWLANPNVLPIVDFMNEWGLTLLGLSLMLGLFVRLSGILGAILMLLYYSALKFPYPNEHAFLVDEHLIYASALLYLSAIRAGNFWGLEKSFQRLSDRFLNRKGKSK